MHFNLPDSPWIIRFCLYFICMTGTLPLFSQTRPSQEEVTIEKKLIEGKKYTLLGDWEKAEALFKAILAEDVQNSVACYELSRTLAAMGKPEEALSYINKAIRIEPDNEWYHLMEADIHEATGNLHATMEVYDRLIRLRPQQAHYYEMQIQFCNRTGEKDRMLNVLDAYEKITGVNETITRTRFETLDELGRKEEALAALDKLAAVYPTDLGYKFLAASYARKIGQEEKAQQYFHSILAIDPDNSRAKLALASVEKQEGDDAGYLKSIMPVINNPGMHIDVKLQELLPYVIKYSETKDPVLGMALLDVSNSLVQIHPKEAKAFAMQGDVYSMMGKDKEAIDSYKQSTALNGSVYTVWEQMLALMIAERAYEDLVVQANKGIDAFPNSAYLYYAAGYGYFKTRQYDQALEVLNEALVISGRNAGQKISVYNLLGLTYDELGDMEKSSFAFETALGIDPKNAETLSNYSLVLSRRISQSEKAIEMTQKVLSQGPQPPAIHEILAQVLFNQKKYQEAYQSMQLVLADDPTGDHYNLAGDIAIKLGKTDEAVSMWKLALDNGCQDTELKKKIADNKTQ